VRTEQASPGDNDWLAAQLACLLRGDRLVLVTGAPGVMTADPRTTDDARLITSIASVEDFLDSETGRRVSDRAGALGRGGMRSKLAAAALAVRAGVPVTLGSTEGGSLRAHVTETSRATVLRPTSTAWVAGTGFRFWLQHAAGTCSGSLVVDDGAAMALQSGASLLSVGVTEVSGEFRAGDVIDVYGPRRRLLARGVSRIGARDLEGVRRSPAHERRARRSGRTVIHRDSLVMQDAAPAA
jgi:glutamate 5-kinase